MASRQVAIESALRGVQEELKRARKRHRDNDRVGSHHTWRNACSILSWCNGRVAPATEYLLRRSKGKGDCQAIGASLNRWWQTSTPLHQLHCTTGPPTQELRQASEFAKKFLREFSLHEHVEQLNYTLGIAPLASTVVKHCMQTAAEGAAESSTAAPVLRAVTRKGQYQWMRRWRGRWSVRLRRISAREQEPLADTRAKVTPCDKQRQR